MLGRQSFHYIHPRLRPNITNLEYRLFRRILGYLNEQESRIARLVSKKWDECFRKEVGLRLNVSNRSYQIFVYQTSRFEKFSKLKFTDATLPLQNCPIEAEFLSVTRLEFHRIVVPYNLLWTFTTCPCIKTLTLNHVVMEATPICPHQSSRQPLTLKLLESIVILSKTSELLQKDKSCTMLENRAENVNELPEDELIIIDFLTKIQYGKLIEVTLFTKAEILSHQPFEKLFDGHTKGNEMFGLTKLIYDNRASIKQFLGGLFPGTFILAWRFIPGNPIWRQQMQIEYFDCYLDLPKEWDIILQVQRNLTYLCINGAYRHWTAIQAMLKKCNKSLIEVRLAGGGFGSTVDLSDFKGCSKLEWMDLILDDCHSMNIHTLPYSLRHLTVNGPLSIDELKAIGSILENLEIFYLNRNLPSEKYLFYGNSTEVVVPATITKSLLKVFLSLANIRSLTFRNCRIEVVSVTSWLETIEGLEAELFQIEGYPIETHGSLEIQIPSRHLDVDYI